MTAILPLPGFAGWQQRSLPRIGLPTRLLVLLLITGGCVWPLAAPWFFVPAGGAVFFLWLCRRRSGELAYDLGLSLLFSLMVVVAAQLFQAANAVELGWSSFWRTFPAVSATFTLARTVIPREVYLAAPGWFPPGLLLAAELALRAIPLLWHELVTICLIQRSRGNLTLAKAGRWPRLLVLPFFARLFEIRDRISFALRSRNIEPDHPRLVVSPHRIQHVLGAFVTSRRSEHEQLD